MANFDLPPDDVELGLEPDPDDVPTRVLRCGCDVPAWQAAQHDSDDCNEAQADALAALEDIRHAVFAGTHDCWHGYGPAPGYQCPCRTHPEWKGTP